MQGSEDKVMQMKQWLQETGSPASEIDHAVFSNEHEVESLSYSDFQIHYEYHALFEQTDESMFSPSQISFHVRGEARKTLPPQ